MTASLPNLNRTRTLLASSLLCALFLSGCGSSRYRADYNGFNAAYADSSNHQMLLNLARLDQHDPTYFLQFGQISVQYQLSSTLNGVINDTIPQNGLHVPILSGVGTLGAGATTTPQFTFIPVTDDKVAQQLLLPLPPEDIYTLFQQGVPVDELLRLAVERFEIYLPNGSITTYSNAPGRCDNQSYIVFLKICGIARELQLAGHLKLRSHDEYVPLADDWTWSPTRGRSGGDKSGDSPSDDTVSGEPSAKDLLDAQDKGLVYRKIGDKWSLYSRQIVADFYVDSDAGETFAALRKDPVYGQGKTLDNFEAILTSKKGFSVQGNVIESKTPGSRLVLRSFLSVLAAAAQEQTDYSAALCEPADRELVPYRERRPVLKLKWNGAGPELLPPLVALDYRSQAYEVTDPVSARVDDSATWNRDIFRLITELAGQASVDTSKFPLPTSLQVLPSP